MNDSLVSERIFRQAIIIHEACGLKDKQYLFNKNIVSIGDPIASYF